MSITLYHNPACGTSRRVLEMLREAGHAPRIVEYLKNPPDRPTLERLFAALGPAMLRRKGTPYDALGLDDPALPPAALLDAVQAHPVLIERPIVETPLGIRLGRPPEAVREILPA